MDIKTLIPVLLGAPDARSLLILMDRSKSMRKPSSSFSVSVKLPIDISP